MRDDIKSRIKAETQDEGLQELLDDVRDNVKRSRNYMSKFYSEWDNNLEIYKSQREEDKEDKRASKRKEPTKQTLPLTYSTIDTAVTYIIDLYFQGLGLFELASTGDEDYPLNAVCDAVVAREVRNNKLQVTLANFFTDIFRFNMGVMKTVWEEQWIEIDAPVKEPEMLVSLSGMQLLDDGPTTEEKLVNMGSVVTSVSPYNFFPDTRLPLKDWRMGQFAADEEAVHIRDLKKLEKSGSVVGTKWVTEYSDEDWKTRSDTTRLAGFDRAVKSDRENDFMVVKTECQMWIDPADYDFGPSGNELWLITMANDDRILSASKMEDANQSFSYDVGQMAFDESSDLSDSLASNIDQLQETATWLLNSRIASVRKNIDAQLVINPTFVEMSDIEARNPFIRLKKSTPPGLGIDAFLQQLKTVDPTTGNFPDMSVIIDLIERVSGVNGNMMGQFHSGRRAATEARNVAAGAAGRMKRIASQNWEAAVGPLGKRLLLNARQWLDEETFTKIVGPSKADQFLAFSKEWYELIGSEDYFVYDGTSQNEKNFTAQSLQELLLGLMGAPELLAAMNIDVVAMLTEIQRLRGIRNLSRFTNAQPRPTIPGVPPVQPQPLPIGPGQAGA